MTDKQKRNIKIGAAAAGTVLATYGTYKIHKYFNDEYTKRLLAQGMFIANNYGGGSHSVMLAGQNASAYVSTRSRTDKFIDKLNLMNEYKKAANDSSWKRYRTTGKYVGNYKNMTLTSAWGSKLSVGKK